MEPDKALLESFLAPLLGASLWAPLHCIGGILNGGIMASITQAPIENRWLPGALVAWSAPRSLGRLDARGLGWLAPKGLGWLSGTLVGSHGPWSAPRSRGYSPMVSWLLRALVGSREPWLAPMGLGRPLAPLLRYHTFSVPAIATRAAKNIFGTPFLPVPSR